MKWLDYREKLGLGFNDNQKVQMLSNMLQNFAAEYVVRSYDKEMHIAYCMMTGKRYEFSYCFYDIVANDIRYSKSMLDMLSIYIAFCNSCLQINTYTGREIAKNAENFLVNSLDKLGIPFEIMRDSDGIFVFPKGAKELDDALVSDVLEWLSDYPNAQRTYIIALQQYSEGKYIRDVADNLRKALEAFFQEVLGNQKNLETNKTEIYKKLGSCGVNGTIIGLFEPLLNAYKTINDKLVKHNDAVDKKLLEFFLYQTGVLIRMVITVCKESE